MIDSRAVSPVMRKNGQSVAGHGHVQTSIMSLSDKVAIITGSSSGIGAATAKKFSENGASLTIIGRDESRLLEVARYCEKASGKKPLCLLLDLTANGNCEEVIRKTVETFKRIDILINCAGKLVMTSLFDTTMEAFDELVALNLRVPFKMTQLCAPYLKVTKGNVVNIFGAPFRVRPGFLPIAMIRDALDRFTKAGAVELAAEGIRMNAVRPGITRTNFLNNLNLDEDSLDRVYDKLSTLSPNNQILKPEEIADTIYYVVADLSPNAIGSQIIVDGGATSYS